MAAVAALVLVRLVHAQAARRLFLPLVSAAVQTQAPQTPQAVVAVEQQRLALLHLAQLGATVELRCRRLSLVRLFHMLAVAEVQGTLRVLVAAAVQAMALLELQTAWTLPRTQVLAVVVRATIRTELLLVVAMAVRAR